MSKLSKQQRRRAFTLCAERDGGARCRFGTMGAQGCTEVLILDHVDNDPHNNPEDGSNWQILCKGHNHQKNPRGSEQHSKFTSHLRLLHSVRKGVRGNRKPKEQERLADFEARVPHIRYAEMKKNSDCEPVFRRTVAQLVDRHGEIEHKTLLNAASEKAEISQHTGSRYLEKMTSILGDFEQFLVNEKTYIKRRVR